MYEYEYCMSLKNFANCKKNNTGLHIAQMGNEHKKINIQN